MVKQVKKRKRFLKVDWDVNVSDTFFKLNKMGNIHTVPKYKIYINDSLSFTIRIFLWLLSDNHEIYLQLKRSMFNTTISNLISILLSYGMSRYHK